MNCCPRPPLSIFASSVAAWSLQPHSSKSACCASRGLIHVTRGAHVCCKHCAVAAQCSRVIAQQRGMRQHRHDWRLRGVRFNFLVSRTFHTVIICNMLVRYVGAPMFAAAAAMSCGADLSHIYCSSAASPPIKSQVYPLSHLAKTLTPLLQNCISQHASLRSCFNVTLCQAPDLIVHPSWSENKTPNPQPNATESPVISKWLPRHTALVIGSGLGRDPTSLAVASHALATGEACVTLNYPRCCACDPPLCAQPCACVCQWSWTQTRFRWFVMRRQLSGEMGTATKLLQRCRDVCCEICKHAYTYTRTLYEIHMLIPYFAA
jgi:hypothetical protein